MKIFSCENEAIHTCTHKYIVNKCYLTPAETGVVAGGQPVSAVIDATFSAFFRIERTSIAIHIALIASIALTMPLTITVTIRLTIPLTIPLTTTWSKTPTILTAARIANSVEVAVTATRIVASITVAKTASLGAFFFHVDTMFVEMNRLNAKDGQSVCLEKPLTCYLCLS